MSKERTYRFEIDNEVYEMTMEELVQNITRTFAEELLNEEEFKMFCEKQNEFLEKQRKEVEEYARTHYIPDELRDAN